MAYEKKVISEDILIEYNHENGFVRLVKEKYARICNYGLHKNKPTIYKIQYSANGLTWSTAVEYPSRTKTKMHKHFHEACRALQGGLKIRSIDLFCNQVKALQ